MERPKYLPFLLLLIAFIGCLAATPDTEQTQDPDPPSELALLMRAMAAHADSVKAAVARGGELPPYPADFAQGLFDATPTDGMHIDPITYPTFGRDYLSKLEALHAGSAAERPRLYNALVQSCANCHGTHCPGPLMRIRKMYVALDQ